MTQKSTVYIPNISARKSIYKTNFSTKIYSGGRKSYPIWIASANFQKSVTGGIIDGMHLHFSTKSFTFPVVSLSFITCCEKFTSNNLTLILVS